MRTDGLEHLRAPLSGARPPVPSAAAAGIRLTEAERGRVVFTGEPS